MTVFWATGKPDGGLNMGSETNRIRLSNDLRKNVGARYKIERVTPESKQQRKFFEGAVVPLITYFQEGMDHKNTEDCDRVRDWLKVEFLGEFVTIKGKSIKRGRSSKGELNKGFLDKCVDFVEEQYGIDPAVVLNPADYKLWKDTIFPWGGPDNYIDYLRSLNKLK